MHFAQQFVLLDVEDTDAVGALVGRRQSALVDAGRREGRAAQGDEDQLAIGAGVDAAGALADGDGGESLHLRGSMTVKSPEPSLLM